MELTNREIIGLYLLLRKYERELDLDMQKLKNSLEKLLFDKLSIQQIEILDILYNQGMDVFKQ